MISRTPLYDWASGHASFEGPKEGAHLGASVEIACFNVLNHGGCSGVNAVCHEIGDTSESKSYLEKEKEPFNTVRGFAASCMVDGGGVERSVKQDIRRIEEYTRRSVFLHC